MSRPCLVVLLAGLLGITGSALAMEKPTVQVPNEGDLLGPNYDIVGSMPYKALLVVMTDCVRTDTGELLGSVPGIRHWTRPDGSFHFRCASPRVFGKPDIHLTYRIRVYETNARRQNGPEAVVTCEMPAP